MTDLLVRGGNRGFQEMGRGGPSNGEMILKWGVDFPLRTMVHILVCFKYIFTL